ncbi:hypothetical protein B0H10DRAFT_2233881 [Mycena sp. CBHHK59/15]|nr:hypothetical protein B0H10DRAFT_2233881 [Mycena sp. CBHHK59/15]
MAEHDGAGFPLSYLLLSTASSIDQGKRTKALTAWAKCVCDTYGITVRFTHVDKDMAEIGMLKDVWNAKISLCWWHLRRAVRTRLASAKLSMTPYDPGRAHVEFSFIDLSFVPQGQADGGEYEGGVPDSITPVVPPSQLTQTFTAPNGLRITIPTRVPGRQPLTTIGGSADPQVESMAVEVGVETRCKGARVGAGACSAVNRPVELQCLDVAVTSPLTRTAQGMTSEKENSSPDTHKAVRTRGGRVVKPTRNADAADLTTLVSAMRARATHVAAPKAPKAKAVAKGDDTVSGTDDEPTEDEKERRRTFCPAAYHEPIITMMEKHYCAHPLLPGYAHPSPDY